MHHLAPSLFHGRHFDRSIIILCVRWYLTYKLSYRDLDGYPATHTAISALKAEEILPQHTKVRTSKYLNNLIEQDHRRVKQRIYPMLGFKRFMNAAITISGIELMHQIRKGQFDISAAGIRGVRVSQLWDAVLAT
jgi:transposase-like protein